MRKPATVLLATALAAAVAVPTANAGTTRTVRLGDDWFVRDGGSTRVTVVRGTRVRWRWTGRDLHNVVVRRGPTRFQSSLKRSGSYRKTLRRRGTYRIVCSIHQPDMRMTLRVR
jgi:plastocyanin